jgi:hypothetical protein
MPVSKKKLQKGYRSCKTFSRMFISLPLRYEYLPFGLPIIPLHSFWCPVNVLISHKSTAEKGSVWNFRWKRSEMPRCKHILLKETEKQTEKQRTSVLVWVLFLGKRLSPLIETLGHWKIWFKVTCFPIDSYVLQTVFSPNCSKGEIYAHIQQTT